MPRDLEHRGTVGGEGRGGDSRDRVKLPPENSKPRHTFADEGFCFWSTVIMIIIIIGWIFADLLKVDPLAIKLSCLFNFSVLFMRIPNDAFESVGMKVSRTGKPPITRFRFNTISLQKLRYDTVIDNVVLCMYT